MTTTARRPVRRILAGVAVGLFLAAAVAPAVYHDMHQPRPAAAAPAPTGDQTDVYHDM